jgi:hypothetical protein
MEVPPIVGIAHRKVSGYRTALGENVTVRHRTVCAPPMQAENAPALASGKLRRWPCSCEGALLRPPVPSQRAVGRLLSALQSDSVH